VGRYDKIHLFDVNVPGTEESYQESATIEAGEDALVVDTPFGRLGLTVCYDIRFPELYRQMAAIGMDILAVPSHINGRQTFCHSMVVDPWGVVLDCYKTGAGFVSADIDKTRLEKMRTSFPVLEHRRFFCESAS